MRKYRILYKDILTFLGLDCGNTPIKMLYLVVLVINVGIINMFLIDYGLSGNDYIVIMLSEQYITIAVIIIQSLTSIGQFYYV